MQQLPQDTLVEIGSFLPKRDLLRLFLANSYFYKTFSNETFYEIYIQTNYPQFYKQFHLSKTPTAASTTTSKYNSSPSVPTWKSILVHYLSFSKPVSGWFYYNHDKSSFTQDYFGKNHMSLTSSVTAGVQWNQKQQFIDIRNGYLSRDAHQVQGFHFGKNSFTVSAWIKAPRQDGARVLSIRQKSTEAKCASFELVVPRYNAHKVSVYIVDQNGTGGHYNVGRTNLDDNQWHHVAVVVDRKNGKLLAFVDGKVDGEQAYSTRATLNFDKPLCIGHWRGVSGHQFEGCIKFLTVWNEDMQDRLWNYYLATCHHFFESQRLAKQTNAHELLALMQAVSIGLP